MHFVNDPKIRKKEKAREAAGRRGVYTRSVKVWPPIIKKTEVSSAYYVWLKYITVNPTQLQVSIAFFALV